MKCTIRGFAPALALAALSGCASLPDAPEPRAAATSCEAIGAEAVRVAEAKRVAVEKEQDAWKAVVPFAVAARYASGKAAGDEAGRQLAALQVRSGQQGCARP
jgi:hypothetical protein